MPTINENHWIQICETIGGTLSCTICLFVARKVYNERARNVTNGMLVFLFLIDAVLTFFYAIGRGGMENDGFCQFQALMIQWFSVAAFLWMSLMSYIMYQWIVRKKHPKRMDKTIRRNQIAIMVSSFILAIILLGSGVYGDSYMWCWIKGGYDGVRLGCFEIILLISWAMNMFVLYAVNRSLQMRTQKSSVSARIGNLLNANLDVQRKLTFYVGVFTFVWFFALLDRFVEYGTGKTVFGVAILHAIFVPLQGVFNAVIYTDMFSVTKYLLASGENKGIPFLGGKKLNEMELKEIMVEANDRNMLSKAIVKNYVPKRYSIFTTTFNMGEAPLQSLYADIKDWIVEGHDIYAIGLQECIDLVGIRELILSHLGGPSKYAMYTTSIGSGNTSLGYHGFIALTVFVKISELKAGFIHATKATTETMATGTDLIITTAQNKGAVGIPLQIHDTNIGFVTCHLPSDSKGKSKLTKRNASAHAILKEVILAPEDLGFDLHLQHDHIMVFGDLNYRMDTSGTGSGVNSLTGVAIACVVEKQIMGDDPLWLSRKYNLLRHHSDPLHPTIEEVKLLHQAKLQSRGAWSSLLRADELRSIMDDGDAFYGFEEPMPCFPPSYKRRKGAEADCGDYSEFRMILKGYSNTGEVENMLEAEQQKKEQQHTGIGVDGKQLLRTVKRRIKNKVSSDDIVFTTDESANTSQSKAKSGSLDHPLQTPDPSVMKKSSGDSDEEKDGEAELEEVVEEDDTESQRASDLGRETESEGGKGQKRRRAVLGKANAKLEPKTVVDPSKLRPPSYTDRILVHSLPDRKDRVTVQSYDFCDTLRVSDHRAVSMTLLLDVNAAVMYNSVGQQIPNPVAENGVAMQEPKFELFELSITGLSVHLLDWEFSNALEEAEGDDEDQDSLISDLRSVRSMSRTNSASTHGDDDIYSSGKEEEVGGLNPLHSNPNSPIRNQKKAIGDGVELNSFNNNDGSKPRLHRVNSVSSRPAMPAKQKSLWKRLSTTVGSSAGESSESGGEGRKLNRKASRKQSVIASFFKGNQNNSNQNESDSDLYDVYGKDKKQEEEEEDRILREMGRESMDWKNMNEGAWRKKVQDEQKRLRSETKEKASLSLKMKKKKKSEVKSIDHITVVFPLPAKDPLIAYRRIYDYSKAFDHDPVKRKDMSDLEKNE